jgi:hypothetical protein
MGGVSTEFCVLQTCAISFKYIRETGKGHEKPTRMSFPKNNFCALISLVTKQGKTTRVQAFSFKNCGGDLAGLSKLQVVPDPIKLPGNFNVSAVGYMKAGLDSPLKVNYYGKIHRISHGL